MPDMNEFRNGTPASSKLNQTIADVTDQVQKSSASVFETIDEVVEHYPVLTMAAVAGVGLMIGMAITKKSRPPLRLERLQRMAGTDYRSRDLERVIKRLEKSVDRTVPRSYDQMRDTVSNWPDMITSLAQAWQTKASSKLADVKGSLPDVADIKEAASKAARQWAK